MKIKLIFCLFFSLNIVFAYSQQQKLNKTVVTSLFDSTASSKLDAHYAFKWNYCLLSRGMLFFNYERMISSPKCSYEIGAGITYRDFVFEKFNDEYKFNNASNIKFGYAVEGAIRYYFSYGYTTQTEFYGFFISPVFSFRKYDIPQNIIFPINNQLSTSFNPGYSFSDFQLKIGHIGSSLFEEMTYRVDLVSEIYVGIAMRYAKINYHENIYDNTTGIGQTNLRTGKKYIPQFLIGIKFGFSD